MRTNQCRKTESTQAMKVKGGEEKSPKAGEMVCVCVFVTGDS